MCTPIFINTFVVFVRLYWFERRFQKIVKEARAGGRSRSRTKTEGKEEGPDAAMLEKGVRGRNIVVLHNDTGQTIGNGDLEKLTIDHAAGSRSAESRSASASSQGQKTEVVDHAAAPPVRTTPTFHRGITFADEVHGGDNVDDTSSVLPQRLNPEQHIAFLENQRNPKDKGALRIPGPKDYDRGREPQQLNNDDVNDEPDQQESPTDVRDPPTRSVTIDAPQHPRLRINTSQKHPTRPQSDNLNISAAETAEEAAPPSGRFLRARSGTFSSLKNWASSDNEHVTPYLSWQPTIGRNSAFVDLTEEQREELGGIEYRSLKTLAVVLVREWLQLLKL